MHIDSQVRSFFDRALQEVLVDAVEDITKKHIHDEIPVLGLDKVAQVEGSAHHLKFVVYSNDDVELKKATSVQQTQSKLQSHCWSGKGFVEVNQHSAVMRLIPGLYYELQKFFVCFNFPMFRFQHVNLEYILSGRELNASKSTLPRNGNFQAKQ